MGNMIGKVRNIKDLRAIESQKYENVDLDHLMMYAVSMIQENELDITFENIVVACFRLFPKKFSLLGFNIFPDAKRVYDCLFRCTLKNKQWLGGKARQGYFITDRSKLVIQEAVDLLNGVIVKKKKADSQTRRSEILMKEIETSSAYQKYSNGKKSTINDSDFCFLLQCTLDSSKEILKNNFIVVKNLAKNLKKEEILKFLTFLERKYQKTLLR